MKNRIIGFVCGAGMMGIFVILLTFCVHGQTRVRWDQLNKYSEPQTKEGEWCTAPNLQVASDKQLVVGPKWTSDDPCYIHYSIIPPGSVDPLSVSKFIAPQIIDINPAFTGDDEIYIWATEPKFVPVTPSKIYVGVKDVNSLQCPTCLIVAQTALPRVFPAGVVPIGFVQITQGKLHPKVNDVLDSHQIHIAGAPMVVHKRENGYFFEINPATVQAQDQQRQLEQSRNQMELARNQAVERVMKAEPVPMTLVKRLTEQVQQLQRRNLEMQSELINLRVPNKQEVISTRRELSELQGHVNQFRSQFSDTNMYMMQARDSISQNVEMQAHHLMQEMQRRLDNYGSRVPVPSSPSDPCAPGVWSRNVTHHYQCVQGDNGWEWIRYRIDVWDTRLAQEVKPGVPLPSSN